MIQQAIQALVEGKNLLTDEISASVKEIVEGKATPSQVGAFLVALREKGETVEEIAAFASTLRGYSLQIHPSVRGRIVDTCGTGGDKVKTLNVSTISAFVAAGAGAYVAKHVGRSVTSKCGSADLLERLGLNLQMEPSKVKESIEQVGIGFMFAPVFNPVMKQVAPVRRELGIRTIFNLMGPLINPVRVDAQLLGVYSPELVPRVAEVLAKLGVQEAIVVHALEGIDEISVTGKTLVSWMREGGRVETREYLPKDFGLEGEIIHGLQEVRDAEEAVSIALKILEGSAKEEEEGNRKMVLVNSAASLVLAQKADNFPEGLELARVSIESGMALKKLEEAIKFSGGTMTRLEEHAKSE